jgi:putative Mg2+ transporter-C (MgtC) family protein
MNALYTELFAGFADREEFARVVVRLVAAMLLGGVVGLQRERAGKPAGLRTHMLVAMGAALFVVVPAQVNMSGESLARVVQGVAAGIGFIGGGAILKLSAEREILGLTTAAGLWLTAAIGVAVGLGGLGVAIVAMLAAWIVLGVLGRVERRIGHDDEANAGRK